jgi:hypothetical protein
MVSGKVLNFAMKMNVYGTFRHVTEVGKENTKS